MIYPKLMSPNTVGFSDDRFIFGLTQLAGRVHRHGAILVGREAAMSLGNTIETGPAA